MQIVSEIGPLRRRIAQWRQSSRRVAFVPTMGALHEGHLSLVRRAAEVADAVVVSIFVNPTQFGPGEDYESYPRDPEADAALLEPAGCQLLFLPSAETIYPPGHSTWIEVEGPSQGFEGDHRPGHFRGVATVVTQLFNMVQPDVAVFGEKDAQQLTLVRKMVRDLHLPVEIVGAPIVREKDGLAMSSRNAYLSAEERRAARILHQSLLETRDLVRSGERNAEQIRQFLRDRLAQEPLAKVDYVGVVNAISFGPIDELRGQCVIPITVRLGRTRLLDNLQIDLTREDHPLTSLDDSSVRYMENPPCDVPS